MKLGQENPRKVWSPPNFSDKEDTSEDRMDPENKLALWGSNRESANAFYRNYSYIYSLSETCNLIWTCLQNERYLQQLWMTRSETECLIYHISHCFGCETAFLFSTARQWWNRSRKTPWTWTPHLNQTHLCCKSQQASVKRLQPTPGCVHDLKHFCLPCWSVSAEACPCRERAQNTTPFVAASSKLHPAWLFGLD